MENFTLGTPTIVAIVVLILLFIFVVSLFGRPDINAFLDVFVKYSVFVIFTAMVGGIFYSGYYAGITGRWWMGLIIVLLVPILNKIFYIPRG